MLVVLVERVLKLLEMAVDLLGPVTLICPAKDPTPHVLGFHHKHAIARHNNVIDLGGAVFGGQGDVLNEVVAGFIEKKFGGEINDRFPGFTFVPGRFDDRRQDEQRN